jgi:alkanesulfonate monooxygenase SsuD/methylene tetrahydromethanopterin reductase-like flavin-dependent oxidoreductase (luciferase family)
MIEIGILHNGASDLKTTRVGDDVVVAGGSLEEVHQSYQRVLVDQVRQGVLADQLGIDYWFMTEHHFIPEGAEFSPNPLIAETAIAAQTKRIRLGQMANILPWWHPIRVAEQAAMLDVISGGRLEFGIGRGYQPREAEVFGRPYGATVQDQERNRAYYHEAFEIIIKAWTQPSFSHHGEFFSIPPSYTKWHHKGTMAYFNQPQAGRKLEDVLALGKPDLYSMGSPVVAATTTLKEISLFPQPVQKPHPQVWEPVTSERSIRWAAANAVNGMTLPETTSRLKRNVEIYYDEAERKGWPDRLNRGPWKFGWDADKHRGYGCVRYVHVVPPGSKEHEGMEQYKRALEMQWDYYGPFGFAAALADLDEAPYDAGMKVTGDLLMQKGVAIVGTPEQVAEGILGIKESCGFEDFLFTAAIEGGGYTSAETEEQMRLFASEVVPILRRECGGGPDLPESTAQFAPTLEPVGVVTGN